ncbi:MAG: hypothetical protein WC798_00670 [Candidatus Paceibacterota bacterium]|jgi:hypothetical protein
MTIAEVREKCKALVAGVPRDVFVIAVLVFASSASFGLGYLAGLDIGGQGIVIGEVNNPPSPEATAGEAGKFVASRNGTKYYLPSCSGASRISESNKVWFSSAEAAVAAGYSPAANCDGI